MARNMQPIVKRCRALGISPAVMGYTDKSKLSSDKRNPNAKKRTKKSEYALQMNEKQKERSTTDTCFPLISMWSL